MANCCCCRGDSRGYASDYGPRPLTDELIILSGSWSMTTTDGYGTGVLRGSGQCGIKRQAKQPSQSLSVLFSDVPTDEIELSICQVNTDNTSFSNGFTVRIRPNCIDDNIEVFQGTTSIYKLSVNLPTVVYEGYGAGICYNDATRRLVIATGGPSVAVPIDVHYNPNPLGLYGSFRTVASADVYTWTFSDVGLPCPDPHRCDSCLACQTDGSPCDPRSSCGRNSLGADFFLWGGGGDPNCASVVGGAIACTDWSNTTQGDCSGPAPGLCTLSSSGWTFSYTDTATSCHGDKCRNSVAQGKLFRLTETTTLQVDISVSGDPGPAPAFVKGQVYQACGPITYCNGLDNVTLPYKHIDVSAASSTPVIDPDTGLTTGYDPPCDCPHPGECESPSAVTGSASATVGPGLYYFFASVFNGGGCACITDGYSQPCTASAALSATGGGSILAIEHCDGDNLLDPSQTDGHSTSGSQVLGWNTNNGCVGWACSDWDIIPPIDNGNPYLTADGWKISYDDPGGPIQVAWPLSINAGRLFRVEQHYDGDGSPITTPITVTTTVTESGSGQWVSGEIWAFDSNYDATRATPILQVGSGSGHVDLNGGVYIFTFDFDAFGGVLTDRSPFKWQVELSGDVLGMNTPA